MTRLIPTRRRKFTMYLDFVTHTPEKIRVVTKDNSKPDTVYSDRIIQVDGKRTCFVSFPISPETLSLEVFNVNAPGAMDPDPSFTVKVRAEPLRDYLIAVDAETAAFLEFNNWFCENAGWLSATRQDGSPSIYTSKNGMFTIKYMDVIRDASGKEMGTPARVGHTTGTMEVAAKYFRPYTIPMRHIILDHEFSHKYRNPKLTWAINDEIGADINALYYYLGRGFSKIDAIWVYTEVFYKANSPENMKRMAVIWDFINRFENQEFAKRI